MGINRRFARGWARLVGLLALSMVGPGLRWKHRIGASAPEKFPKCLKFVSHRVYLGVASFGDPAMLVFVLVPD